jgi:hypothetical protein
VDFPTVTVRGVDDRIDDRIQSWRVSAAGVDGDSFDVVHGCVHGDSAKNGSAFQISLAYSAMVRSLENRPAAAMFRITWHVHARRSAYNSPSR